MCRCADVARGSRPAQGASCLWASSTSGAQCQHGVPC
eukprot:CAMPEP_0204286498 /NCGR_PEP_ID=MMETSP0468-20130131/52856_1 /ASSEMBLY_ACC=CAM_ASM_000383 /TAXON_ID=2969 /ORGANISM="Oxyrrhis marina" /LENGTH=36 /DNA_ID= /DNA_START= /DNA_END= /DNA_ORIENTATION=